MKKTAPAALAAALASGLLLAACTTTAPPPAPEPPPPAPPSAFVEKLGADGLFAFGKASVRDIGPEGRAELDALAARLTGNRPLEIVHVIGHSDRIGTAQANLRLSNRRADAVRDYLVEQGVPADRITAVGRGDVEPVIECTSERGEALVACLAPNRRVEVRVRFAD
ncbi:MULTISPECIES: OmpA family protein [Luteimonas]|uniref:OmpA family protein n=1 Tax=Luteimonas TaxID=83614 RepID=UPI001304125B|nr:MULTISPECIES: OmpA family protein [Luteimonas]